MSCKRARRLFNAYWDDEVTQAEREWLESHFSACAECRGEYETLVRTIEMIGSIPREEPSLHFVEHAVTRAKRAAMEPDRVPGGNQRWIPITAAAALLAVLGGTAIQWAGLSTAPEQRSTTRAAIQQPTWVGPAPPTGSSDLPGSAPVASSITSVPDSLFDHSEDVEFILDPVTLRKGRAHTTMQGADAPRAQQATITF